MMQFDDVFAACRKCKATYNDHDLIKLSRVACVRGYCAGHWITFYRCKCGSCVEGHKWMTHAIKVSDAQKIKEKIS